jgi:hypothetical protein
MFDGSADAMVMTEQPSGTEAGSIVVTFNKQCDRRDFRRGERARSSGSGKI